MLAHGIALSKVNPRVARRFAEVTGNLAKTDRADAEMLSRYGVLLEPRLLQKGAVTLNDLRELHAARTALMTTRPPKIVRRTSPSVDLR
jgi:transposase